MQSLNMLVCTEGKERSAGEYEALLRAAGFADVGRATDRHSARRDAGANQNKSDGCSSSLARP